MSAVRKTRLALVDEHGNLVPVKSARLQLRCTDSQRAEVEAAAGRLNLTLSDYFWHVHQRAQKSKGRAK